MDTEVNKVIDFFSGSVAERVGRWICIPKAPGITIPEKPHKGRG